MIYILVEKTLRRKDEGLIIQVIRDYIEHFCSSVGTMTGMIEFTKLFVMLELLPVIFTGFGILKDSLSDIIVRPPPTGRHDLYERAQKDP